ncbi:serine hydrolase [Bacillus sp. 2205SS5-2]|uniref:serine hydrolase n=1 Tax=Bacillus sp. 2205SS5-2 TaxID=3109031 RepID=UPI003006A3DE
MTKHFVKQTSILFLTSLILLSQLPLTIKASTDLNINADAAILVDADSGEILYKQNEDQPLGIASMTKMMTEYLVLEAIASGKITWEQPYTVSDKVYALANAPGLSNVPLRENEAYSVKELYEAMVIKSANGASIALAEIVAGSEGEFVRLMNRKAAELGLEHYQFVNSTGLSNYDMFGLHPEGTGFNDENLLSAQDTATLAYHLLNDYPELLQTANLSSETFREGTSEELVMKNTNAMLQGRKYEYAGIDGLKTGTTPFAGSTFTGTAERDGTRYITVIMNSKDAQNQPSSGERFIQTGMLLDFGYNSFGLVDFSLADYDQDLPRTIEVADGEKESLSFTANDTIQLKMNKSQKENVNLTLIMDESKLDEDGKLQAPVEKGEKIGELLIENPQEYEWVDKPLFEKYTIDVFAEEAVEKSNWFVLTSQAIGDFFKKLF